MTTPRGHLAALLPSFPSGKPAIRIFGSFCMSNGTSPTGAPYGSSSHPALLDAENVATAGSSARPLDPTQLFDGVRLLILGGTGFLGKIFWVLLLHRYPEVGKIFMLVRKSKTETSEQRFWSTIATSEALEPLRERPVPARQSASLAEERAVGVGPAIEGPQDDGMRCRASAPGVSPARSGRGHARTPRSSSRVRRPA